MPWKYLFIFLFTFPVALLILFLQPAWLKKPLERAFVINDLGFYNFNLPTRSTTANDALWVNTHYQWLDDATSSQANAEQIDDLTWPRSESELAELLHWITRQPDVTLITQRDDQYEWVVRTPIMRYPDRISLSIQNRNAESAHLPLGLALYSRSLYGRKDFSVNRNRLFHWLKDYRAEYSNN